LETLVEQQRQQEAELRSQIQKLSTAPAQAVPAAVLPQLTPEVESLQATLQMLQPQHEYYRGQEEQLQAEVEKLRAELAARSTLPSDTPALPSDASTPTTASPPETETLRANLQVLAAEVDTYRTDRQLQQSKIDRLRQEAARLQGDLDQARAQTAPAEELAHWRASAQALEAQLAESQSLQQKLQLDLEQSRGQTAQFLAELEQQRQPPVPAPGGSAAQPTPASASPFIDPEHGLAEMLEALAGAEARITRQAEEIAGLHRSLAENLRPTPAPTPARPLQAADMEVIASLTQELRQPMSSIIGYVDLLLSESVGIIGALQRKFLERIKASSERIGVLLDDLMRVMDIDSGNLKLAQESVNVVQVIDDALRNSESQFREKGLRLAADIPPNLPPVQADRDALLQIFSHLINNSGAASANDTEVRLSVRHEIEQRPGADPLNYLIISVTDTGGGIAPEDQPRVFSRLYRADAPLIAGLGDNGMGLSIAKALVEGHGGRIWVITDPGTGSTFYVLLPLEGKYARSNGARAAAH
jgi:signal transduction histidine kinase